MFSFEKISTISPILARAAKTFLLAIITIIGLSGCEKKTQIGFTEDDLKQSWVLTKVDGKDVKTAEPRITPTMAIDTDLKIAGFSGCNRFFGQIELTDNNLTVTSMGSTKMACIQDDQASLEALMTTSLQKANTIALENNTLTLTSDQHILTFMPEEIPEDDAQ
ncbi:META domain-containing protein [Photobacterium sanguinicancri]|uniref:META domain-containing protein n=1 Tax=Photobacterium sanguinicancri TaxID=875932 RepID=A0AAW7Y062_9GAMM|nr:META domain-containing protein [Photobacterium sanguinicancri]MDO6541958.1 META domain-containing protein [Photobacterium sanguinicancri]